MWNEFYTLPTYLTHFLFSLIALKIIIIKRYSKKVRLSATGLPLSYDRTQHIHIALNVGKYHSIVLFFLNKFLIIFCSSLSFLISFLFASSACSAINVFNLNIATKSLARKDFWPQLLQLFLNGVIPTVAIPGERGGSQNLIWQFSSALFFLEPE